MPPSSNISGSSRNDEIDINVSRGYYDAAMMMHQQSQLRKKELQQHLEGHGVVYGGRIKPEPLPLHHERQPIPGLFPATSPTRHKTGINYTGPCRNSGVHQQPPNWQQPDVTPAPHYSMDGGCFNSDGSTNRNLGYFACPPMDYGPTMPKINHNGSTSSSQHSVSSHQMSLVGTSETRPLKPPAASSSRLPSSQFSMQDRATTQKVSTAAPLSDIRPFPVTPSPSSSTTKVLQFRMPRHQPTALASQQASSSPSSSHALTSARSVATSEATRASSPSTTATSHSSTPTTNNLHRQSNRTKDLAFGRTSADAIEWRKHGKRFRAQIVLEDEEKGGNTFDLSNDCSIERYYKVAERVLEQFLSTSIRKNENEMELAESYLVGNRLVKFLSIVLPTHYEYFSNHPKLQALRKQSQSQLVELLQYLEEVAIVIDELQYNKYILRDLTPEEEDLVLGLTGFTTTTKGSFSASPRWNSSSGSQASSPASVASSCRQQSPSTQSSPQQSLVSRQSDHSAGPSSMDTSVASHQHSVGSARSGSRGSGRDDTLQHKVAQVIRVTEAFSDAYEATCELNERPASNAMLKQKLRAAATAAASSSQHQEFSKRGLSKLTSTQGRPSMQPPAPPPVTRTNRLTIVTPRQTMPSSSSRSSSSSEVHHHPDPDVATIPFTEVSPKEDSHPSLATQEGGISASTSPSFWDIDGLSDFDFGNPKPDDVDEKESVLGIALLNYDDEHRSIATPSPRSQSRIDLLEQATDCGESTTKTVAVDRVKAQGRASNTSSHGFPKLKHPPQGPSRATLARAAAALEQQKHNRAPFNNLEQQQQQGREDEEKKSDLSFPATLKELPWDEPVFKTKIEERMERASAVQDELTSIERRQFDHYASLQRWRRPIERNPTNPFDDHYVGDENIIVPAQAGPKNVAMSNGKVLRHFKGCVQCLLD